MVATKGKNTHEKIKGIEMGDQPPIHTHHIIPELFRRDRVMAVGLVDLIRQPVI